MGLGEERSPVTCIRALGCTAVFVDAGIVGGVGRGLCCWLRESRVGLPLRCGWILGFIEANEFGGGDFEEKSSKFGFEDVGRCWVGALGWGGSCLDNEAGYMLAQRLQEAKSLHSR